MNLTPDPPLEPRAEAQPLDAEVIDLDGIRVQWGLPRWSENSFEHADTVYSTSERRVWCKDCNRTIENFDAFMMLVKSFQRMESAARLKMQKAEEALTAMIHLRATKEIDKAWSSQLCAVGCPHCRKGILPEDFANGVKLRMAREYEMARRLHQK